MSEEKQHQPHNQGDEAEAAEYVAGREPAHKEKISTGHSHVRSAEPEACRLFCRKILIFPSPDNRQQTEHGLPPAPCPA